MNTCVVPFVSFSENDDCACRRKNKHFVRRVYYCLTHAFTDLNISNPFPERNSGAEPLQQGKSLLSELLPRALALYDRQPTGVPLNVV